LILPPREVTVKVMSPKDIKFLKEWMMEQRCSSGGTFEGCRPKVVTDGIPWINPEGYFICSKCGAKYHESECL